jgi:hypothetical protein
MPMNNRLMVPRQTGYLSSDADVRAYLAAVRIADGASLEIPVARAIEAFVLGCKSDGIWTAIKAACLLAGPRTLAGCLVPLVGTAPTNSNFVSADYNRKTGLVGNGSTKVLNSNRASDADPQNNFHQSVWATTVDTVGRVYIGVGGAENGSSSMNDNGTALGGRCRNNAYNESAGRNVAGFLGQARTSGTEFIRRGNGGNATITIASQTPIATQTFRVFAVISSGGTVSTYSSARLAWYSIGEFLNMALLDARLATYISSIGSAIP